MRWELCDLNTTIKNDTSPVFINLAAREGNVASLRALGELGANVNAHTPNNNGATPAFIAAQSGHEATLRVLGELGADLNRSNDVWGYSCICSGSVWPRSFS